MSLIPEAYAGPVRQQLLQEQKLLFIHFVRVNSHVEWSAYPGHAGFGIPALLYRLCARVRLYPGAGLCGSHTLRYNEKLSPAPQAAGSMCE